LCPVGFDRPCPVDFDRPCPVDFDHSYLVDDLDSPAAAGPAMPTKSMSTHTTLGNRRRTTIIPRSTGAMAYVRQVTPRLTRRAMPDSVRLRFRAFGVNAVLAGAG
jgi:hypothetical protein